MDPIRVGLIWRRIEGVVDQVAETFLRAAFSVVVRDNYDMAFSLFDSQGRLIAQSKRSIPSFTGTLPRTLEAVLARYPVARLDPGDTLISNDSWIGTGHLNDISMIHPIFRAGRLIAFVGSTAHTVDIGGAPSPTARDRYEEGLCIPICKIVERGEESETVIDFLTQNLRHRMRPSAISARSSPLIRIVRRSSWICSPTRTWPISIVSRTRSSPVRRRACARRSPPYRTGSGATRSRPTVSITR